jgi:hypothetical protein
MVRGLESSLVLNGKYARPRVFGAWLAVVLLVSLSGCPRGKQAESEGIKKDAAAPRASVALRVLVVNEPGVAEAINRLRGEWAERSGGELSATSSDWKDVAGAKSLEADVVIFPSRYLGEMCTRGWLQPMRSSVLEGDEFDAKDVFPIVRRELMRWGGEVMALPLGVELAVPGNQNNAHPGLSFLAVAAPGAVTDGREGVLFDPQTMKPRITDAVFVEALQRLAKAEPGKKPEGRDDAPAVPVFGFADRLMGVTTSSRNGASAFKLAAWLASAEVSTQLASGGERMLPVRRSLAAPTSSRDSAQSSDEGAESAKNRKTSLNSDRCLLVPRIPGVDEYMAALDEAAKTPPADKAAAEAALQKVAARWEQITNAHGRESQRRAYLKHLQISE